MSAGNMIVLEEDHARYVEVLEQLCEQCNAKCAVLVDRSGQAVAGSGEIVGGDPTALASLTAGNVAATEGLAQLIGDDVFSSLYHEGKNDSLHISLVSEKIILLVIFDEHSSLGLVRLRVQQMTPELENVTTLVLERAERGGAEVRAGICGADFEQITDEDIDALFG